MVVCSTFYNRTFIFVKHNFFEEKKWQSQEACKVARASHGKESTADVKG